MLKNGNIFRVLHFMNIGWFILLSPVISSLFTFLFVGPFLSKLKIYDKKRIDDLDIYAFGVMI